MNILKRFIALALFIVLNSIIGTAWVSLDPNPPPLLMAFRNFMVGGFGVFAFLALGRLAVWCWGEGGNA